LPRIEKQCGDAVRDASDRFVTLIPMSRACLFCGEPANSREHAFPQWLNTLAPLRGRALNTRESGTRGWLAGGFDHKVRQVCRRCNNGWMSQLEVVSKPLVTELATDERSAPLSVGEQIKLAAWLYKTAIMLALTYAAVDRYVPRDHYRGFFEHRKAPRFVGLQEGRERAAPSPCPWLSDLALYGALCGDPRGRGRLVPPPRRRRRAGGLRIATPSALAWVAASSWGADHAIERVRVELADEAGETPER
jgi:hypothetical protein